MTVNALRLFEEPRPEKFSRASNAILRHVTRRNGGTAVSEIAIDQRPDASVDLASAYDESWLRSAIVPRALTTRPVRIADLFSGCGAMTLGIAEACRALNVEAIPTLAVDFNPHALGTYQHNFPGAVVSGAAAETLIDGEIRGRVTSRERKLLRGIPAIDFLVGGPPCQGNSDLNNHTRRRDPKNRLMRLMARAAELMQPQWVLIENVPGVVHDTGRVVDWTTSALVRLGYSVDVGVIDVSRIGVAQKRRRFVIAASRTGAPSVSRAISGHEVTPRTLRRALRGVPAGEGTYDTSARHSRTNQERIETLFRLGVHDLPDEYRPDCHRLKRHSYKAVYGRMQWDEPAPTITAGFGSTGQGRFVHPEQPRTLTPHEAARVQFIPDFFTFPDEGRVALQEMIGNAVPPKLAYVIGLDLMR